MVENAENIEKHYTEGKNNSELTVKSQITTTSGNIYFRIYTHTFIYAY